MTVTETTRIDSVSVLDYVDIAVTEISEDVCDVQVTMSANYGEYVGDTNIIRTTRQGVEVMIGLFRALLGQADLGNNQGS